MNTAIIVAAGIGTRLDPETPKQFIEIHGKPLIVYTLERFESCSAIDEIVAVVAEGEAERFRAMIEPYEISKLRQVVTGGRLRAESVANGLAAVDPATEIVAVHDGARPLVSTDEILRTVNAAREFGAACLVGSIPDTIKEVDGETIVGTLDRRQLRRALTPQAFKLEILKRAFEEAGSLEQATDECFLVEQLGERVEAVPGNSRNIKVTFPADLAVAEHFLGKEAAE